jgi:uncharacterized phage protein (TIGR02216 family)
MHSMQTERTLPWKAMQRLAYGVLKLSPDNFWAMTYPEFVSLLEGAQGFVSEGVGQMTCTREKLENLLREFPDKKA